MIGGEATIDDLRKRIAELEHERDALAAHINQIHECFSFDATTRPQDVCRGILNVLKAKPATSLSTIKRRWQAEALESLASDCAGNRDVYERCMVCAADLRIQQQGDEVENNG